MNFSNSSPQFASITRCDARFSGSVVISTNGKPTSFASVRISLKAFVAYPFRCFHGTTEYPMWPRHVGGSAVVLCCHLRPIFPANSPSHIQRRIPGNLGTTEPSGKVIGGPFASGASILARKAPALARIISSSSSAAAGRELSHDQPCSRAEM